MSNIILDLQDKESIVDLLMKVQAGLISCRKGAKIIMAQVPKRRLTADERARLAYMRRNGCRVRDLANEFRVDPATVWRICKAEGASDE